MEPEETRRGGKDEHQNIEREKEKQTDSKRGKQTDGKKN